MGWGRNQCSISSNSQTILFIVGSEIAVHFAFSARTKNLVRVLSRPVRRFALLALACLAAGFASSCSTSNSSIGNGGGDSPNANNVRLKGNYTYTLGGSFSGVNPTFCSYCSNGLYERGGTFISDGNGHITGGSDNFVQGTSPTVHAVSGSYAVAADGTGLMMLSIGGAQFQLAFAIASDNTVNWIEFDAFASGAGGARLQDTSVATSVPNGTFVFHIHSSLSHSGSQGSISAVGRMMISNGTITGNEDIV